MAATGGPNSGGVTPTNPTPHAPRRKPLRKGTQSCTECRRRKIRCTFPPGDPSICIPCSARGSQCLDQRASKVPVDESGTLRERVARLESLLEGLLRNKQGGSPSTGDSRRSDSAEEGVDDVEEASSIDGDVKGAPLMSILGDALANEANHGSEVWSHNATLINPNKGPYSPVDSNSRNGMPYSLPAPTSPIKSPCSYLASQIPTKVPSLHNKSKETLNDSTRKPRLICEKLRSSLPKYDDMMAVFAKGGTWWGYWRQKTYGETKPTESLLQYAARTYTSEVPTDLGLLVCAFGLSTDTNGSRYLALVDRLIISDNEYAATITGLECIVLQAKCYLDTGQPRRAWLTYRKGLVLAQLMNLHRTHRETVEGENVWWALYQGDRFISILLGLPYSVNDAHIDLNARESSVRLEKSLRTFIVRCGVAAGKLIDRNQSTTEPSLSKTIEIEDELQAIAVSMPQSWWDISKLLLGSSLEATEVRLTLLIQVFFLFIRMYLHLQFLFKSQQGTSNLYDQSNAACLDSARMMVQRYHMLRSDFRGQCLYECKSNDFMGFTATVILLIGIAHSKRTSLTPGRATMQELEDWSLSEHSLAIFERLNKQSPCKLFSQSHRALFLLMTKEHLDLDKSSSSSAIFIPYFGKVSVQRDSESRSTSWSDQPHQHVDTQSAATPQRPVNGNVAETPEIPNDSASFGDGLMADSANFWEFEPAPTLHDSFSLPGSSSLFGGNDFLAEAEYFGSLPEDGDPFAWLNDNVPMIDIDQDWSCMEQ